MSARQRRRSKKEPVKVEESEPQRPSYLLWDEPPHIRTMALQTMTVQELKEALPEILGLSNHKSCMREAVLLDYYVSGFCWTNERKFSPTQTSFIMAALQMLINNIRENKASIAVNTVALAKALAPACFRVIPGDDRSALLNHEEAKKLIDYVVSSLFQHYKLYMLVLTTPREEIVVGLERTIEVFEGTFEPLAEGTSVVLPEVTTHVSLP